MRLPRLLDGSIVPCISLTVNQSLIPLSNATMEVLKGDVLPIRTFVEISTPNGITEIYRTRQPQVTHGSDIATIQLDHAISEVGDFLIQDAIEEETTVSEAFSTIFSHYRGTAWQLGTITASDDVTLDVDYDNVLESLLGILEQVPQYYMTFDFTTSPWTLGLAEKTYTVTAEGRLSRNIESAVVKYDDKDQCTRVYVKGLPKPSGQEDDEDAIGYMDADANTIALYGIIEKETGSGNLTEAQATRVATTYLNTHKLPKKSVEINGDDLSEITGESLDSFVIGKLFRLAIPQDGQVVQDYITKVSFQDIISSSFANVVIGEELDAAINFLQEQASSTKSSRSAAKKQQKLDDAFEKNFVKTDEYGAILEQAGMKLDSHGMIVYARDNVNNIGSILDMTASEIRSEVAAGDLGLRSEISQTASAIRLSVDSSLSDIGSNIVQTADQIYSDVHAANSTIYSYISQTATSITSRVENINDDLHTEILQTQSMIRSAVWTANSQVYSYVDQTASYILDHVGERSGSKVYTGTEPPEDTPENPLNVGDLWVEGTLFNVWDDMEGEPWIDYDPTHPEYDWSQLKGQKVYVWKDGKWQLCMDETTVVEDTDFVRTKEALSLIAYNQKVIDGEYRANVARLDVRADKITANVEERVQQLGSNITQTAQQIRAEVHAANSQLYSAIEQTATSIRSYVVDEINDLGSEISQTASQIRLEVHAARSQLYSAIEQTATSIRSYVKNEIDDVGSEILQTASMIRAEVHASSSRIYSSITQTASAIRSEVGNAISGVQSSITQTANTIRAEVNAANSKVYSSITQTASSIRSEVANAISGVNSSITQTANSIRSEVNTANSKVYSSITQTASSIRSEVASSISSVRSSITQTANSIRSEVNAANSKVYSSITQTASSIRAEVSNAISGVNSSISQTANTIRSEVNAANSKVYSSITQTASSIRSEVANTISGVRSSITQTANTIRSEVNTANSKIYSSITQTASSIRSEVASTSSSIRSSITQTANQIRSEVNAAKSSLSSSITQTASQIRLEVKNTASGLQSQITQNADNISLKVSKNGVISSINQTAEEITIKASKINLSGYVKATDITADLIKTKISLIDTLAVGYVSVASGKSITLQGTSNIELSYASMIGVIKDLKIERSGNTYTLSKKNFNGGAGDWVSVGTFSRAVSTWNWRGGDGQVKVTAQPQGQTLGVDLRVSGNTTISSNGSYTFKAQYADDNGSYWDTGASKSVTVALPYKPTALGQSVKDKGEITSWTKKGSGSNTFYYNDSSGRRSIRIYTYPTITIDGVPRNLDDYSLSDYITGAPTAVYNFGHDSVTPICVHSGDNEMSHNTIPLSRNQTYEIWAGYLSSDGETYLYNENNYKVKAPSGTSITMTRGAYNQQSHTYTCTCTLGENVATAASFTLYYMTP